MQRKIFDARLFTTVLLLIGLLLFTFASPLAFEGGALCKMSLDDTSEGQLMYVYKTYGWPLGFLTVSDEGCFEQRLTQRQWDLSALLTDVCMIGCLGTLPYTLPWLWRRWRAHP